MSPLLVSVERGCPAPPVAATRPALPVVTTRSTLPLTTRPMLLPRSPVPQHGTLVLAAVEKALTVRPLASPCHQSSRKVRLQSDLHGRELAGLHGLAHQLLLLPGDLDHHGCLLLPGNLLDHHGRLLLPGNLHRLSGCSKPVPERLPLLASLALLLVRINYTVNKLVKLLYYISYLFTEFNNNP
jgi:hypothetical protein